MKMPIESQKGILKKLSYNDGQYDDYKLVEFLTNSENTLDDRKQAYYNMANSSFYMQSRNRKVEDEDTNRKEDTRNILTVIFNMVSS